MISVVIACAGVGSRLGFNKPKALVDIYSKPLIQRQIELLQDIEDVRVVVGYMAPQVIEAVKEVRDDVKFIYNNDYLQTKTAASYFLGAKDAIGEYVLELDGDVIIHPDDMKMLLKKESEWIGYAIPSSEDTIFVKVNSSNEVVSFSRKEGDFEWTGPCCLRKENIKYLKEGHIYNILEDLLPMEGVEIRACDMDTYEDYQRGLKFFSSFSS